MIGALMPPASPATADYTAEQSSFGIRFVRSIFTY